MSDVYWSTLKKGRITIQIDFDKDDPDDEGFPRMFNQRLYFIGPGQAIDLSTLPLAKEKPEAIE